MSLVIKNFNAWRPFINDFYVAAGENGLAEIAETSSEGRGTASFSVAGKFLVLKGSAGTHQIRWLKSAKCADGCVVHVDEDDIHVHIIELKSRVNGSEWSKVQEQFEGMYLNALALLGLMEVRRWRSITCYLAYRREALSAQTTAAASLVKHLPGMPQRRFNLPWEADRIQLPNGATGELKKVLRDDEGNAFLGTLPASRSS